MAPLPTPVRAALGLVANAVDSARTLPERAVELPVLAVSTALQFSLRAQQRYAELTLRGDELLNRLQGPPEEPPSWATFDDVDQPADQPDRPPDDLPPPDDIPIARPSEDEAPVTSAAKQPRKASAAAKRSGAKAVRPPRKAKPSAFDDASGND